MKAILTSKRSVGILALLLAIIICFSACGGEVESSSTDGTGEDAATDTSVVSTASENKTEDKTEDNASTGSKNQATASKNTTVVGKTVWDKDYLKSMPASVKNKGVKLLLWRKLENSEQKMINDFTKKTGCKVDVITTTEAAYSTKLVSMITAKESPDVCVLMTTQFPSIASKSMQPLDDKIFRLKDDCWNKQYMDTYIINGKYYGVAMSGAWNCTDTVYMTYYQPSVLKSCGVTRMPYELWKEGKWNWEEQYQIASAVKKAGKSYTGISYQSSDLFMLSAGVDFVTYNGKKFTNNLGSAKDDSVIVKAWKQVCRLSQSI